MEKQFKAFGFEFEAKADGDRMLIEGYGSTFGNIDHGNDIVISGAFKDSLQKRMPKMLWQHDKRQIPGVWREASEDSRGLYLKGEFLNTSLGRDVYEQAKAGAIDTMSIGYSAKDFEIDSGVRTLKQVDLFEVSLVTFPMNEQARIVAVKGLPQTVREFENFLRDAGFGQEAAKIIVAKGFKALSGQREVEAEDAITIQAATKLAEYLKNLKS